MDSRLRGDDDLISASLKDVRRAMRLIHDPCMPSGAIHTNSKPIAIAPIEAPPTLSTKLPLPISQTKMLPKPLFYRSHAGAALDAFPPLPEPVRGNNENNRFFSVDVELSIQTD